MDNAEAPKRRKKHKRNKMEIGSSGEDEAKAALCTADRLPRLDSLAVDPHRQTETPLLKLSLAKCCATSSKHEILVSRFSLVFPGLTSSKKNSRLSLEM